MKQLSKLNPFLFISFIFLLLCAVLVITYPQNELHLLINSYHSPFLDVFFKYITHLGSGFVVLPLILVVSLIKKRNFTKTISLGLLSYAISGIVILLLKHFVFSGYYRPVKAIGAEFLYLVSGVSMNAYNSFPSGHSASAFAFFIFLAFLFYKNKALQIIFAFVSVLVAFSRVYLSQHFVEDISVGSIIGIFSFYAAFFLFQLIFKSKVKSNRIEF